MYIHRNVSYRTKTVLMCSKVVIETKYRCIGQINFAMYACQTWSATDKDRCPRVEIPPQKKKIRT